VRGGEGRKGEGSGMEGEMDGGGKEGKGGGRGREGRGLVQF